MTVTVSFPAGIKTRIVAPDTVSKTAIYSIPAASTAQAWVASVRATNKTGSGATLALHLYTTVGTIEGLLRPAATIAANTTEVIELGVALQGGDELRATLGTADAFDLIITYAERTRG